GNARVDPGQQLVLSHLVARLDGHLDDLAPCLGLDAEREDRLHHARRARRDDDVATRHRDRLIERCRLGLLARGGAAHEDGDTPGTEQALHDLPFVCTSRSTSPSRKWIWREACAAMSASWVTSTMVWPVSCSSSNSRMISSPVAESRMPVGSSASRIDGAFKSARANATPWRGSPETAFGSDGRRSASQAR